MYFVVAMLLLNTILVRHFVLKLSIHLDKYVIEASGRRRQEKSVYKRCIRAVNNATRKYKKIPVNSVEKKLRKAGYTNEYSALIYLLLKYAIPVILSITSFINRSSIAGALAPSLIFMGAVELYIHTKKRSLTLRFEKNAYRIYRYLHNQVSAGIKVTDAIKTVHEMVDDKLLKSILVRLAARYSLTLDIDQSLDEFKSFFDAGEAHTLCTALKQGVETGDNKELLAAQEEEMFNMYFNYIQAETDNCKIKSALAAVMYTAIIVIMIGVPLFNDIAEGVSKIFIN